MFDKTISTAVAYHFPEFYRAEGANFVQFVKAYYEWMEQSGYEIDASKSLLDYKDIDTTVDQFADRFKNEFLVNFPAITPANRNILVKRVKDFYTSKGSTQGLQLLFRLLYDDDITVYDPGTDILKPSDGIWKVPQYIEVESNPKSKTFTNQVVTGAISGATAFVDSVYSTTIKQRFIDVLRVSDVMGNFIYGELITVDGNLTDAPKVTGSLTSINVVNGGANNTIGDLFNITSSTYGKLGSARVVSTTDGSGRVNFQLVDGGSGFTTDAAQVHVSSNVLYVSKFTQSNAQRSALVTDFEYVNQPLTTLSYSVTVPVTVNAASVAGSNVYGYDATNTLVANGVVVATNAASNGVTISVLSGDFTLAANVTTTGNSVVFDGFSTADATARGIVTGSNATHVGLHSVTNKFYANAMTYGETSNTFLTVTALSTGSGATFGISFLTNTEVVSVYNDVIGGNNVNGIPYLNMVISGSNSNTGLLPATGSITCNSATSNVTGVGSLFTTELAVGGGLYTTGNVFIGTVNAITNATALQLSAVAKANVSSSLYKYNTGQLGFTKTPTATYNSFLFDILSYSNYTIGSIAQLGSINPGTNYNINPFVAVRNDVIAAYNRKNLILSLANKTGVFAIGDVVSQNVVTSYTTVQFNANTAGFISGEPVTQSNGTSNSYATVSSINGYYLTLTDVKGTFSGNSLGGQAIKGISSTATANVLAVSSPSSNSIAKGIITRQIDSFTYEVKRTSFNTTYVTGVGITTTSGGTANIVSVTQNTASRPMGFNASLTANVSTAKGIAATLQVLDSGHGYFPGETVTLTSSNVNNQFVITGTANVFYNGVGTGYWENNQGKLSSDKYIQDNYYYQDFAYEVQSKLSLDKYSEVLKQLAHVAGTKMFGRVNVGSKSIMNFAPVSAIVVLVDNEIRQRNNNLTTDRAGTVIQLRG